MVVQLPGAPLRWGIAWRLDDAEPGTIVLTYVVPGSPAANAGLRVGDRVYQVGGRDFADEATFVQWAKSPPRTTAAVGGTRRSTATLSRSSSSSRNR